MSLLHEQAVIGFPNVGVLRINSVKVGMGVQVGAIVAG